MLLLILSYVGGFLTILSPCILPVLPFVFAKADQPFYKSGLPLLLGMAFTFALASVLAVVGGSWFVQASQWGRWIALVLLTLFALSLIFPSYLEHLLTPLTRWGSQLSESQRNARTPAASFVIGVATGLLWAPCAGPILGLILTGAAIQESPWRSALLLLAYAFGAGSSMALALMAGGKFFGRMKNYMRAESGVKKILGFAILAGVLVIAFNLDRTVLTRISRLQTENVEHKLLDLFGPAPVSIPEQREMPELRGATLWLNSSPLSKKDLLGKVVLIDFWTYSCINCLRTLPYVKAWAQKYKDQGLMVIGVHTPEFAFEKDPENVRRAVKDLGISYPVALDNDYIIWSAFENQYWPAHYFVDRKGDIRHHHFGEGNYEESEKVLQELLGEEATKEPLVKVEASGSQAPGDFRQIASYETYVGYLRAENMKTEPPLKADEPQKYSPPVNLRLNEWGLSGVWQVGPQDALLVTAPGKIIYRFHARDLHLVLGSDSQKEVRFRVLLNGKAPGADRGVDVAPDGSGVIRGHRLYQLIRQKSSGPVPDKTFEIEFFDPGVRAYAFTFG